MVELCTIVGYSATVLVGWRSPVPPANFKAIFSTATPFLFLIYSLMERIVSDFWAYMVKRTTFSASAIVMKIPALTLMIAPFAKPYSLTVLVSTSNSVAL
jgi:hypothetical protein